MTHSECPFCRDDPSAIVAYFVEVSEGGDPIPLVRRICQKHRTIAGLIGEVVLRVIDERITKEHKRRGQDN